MRQLGKFSIGLGDRFGRQGKYQLEAVCELLKRRIEVIPVWNKSHREHLNTHTSPESVLQEAQEAVSEVKWKRAFHVDADHITLKTVPGYIASSDYFTIDVAHEIGHPKSFSGADECVESFLACLPPQRRHMYHDDQLRHWAQKYGHAANQAGLIYAQIREAKGSDNFIAEVSMDEVETFQTPGELFFILFLLKSNGIHLQTIAPKFPGRFNKGIDYDGDTLEFARYFEQYLLCVSDAVKYFNLPKNLKLSIHTGSDKFSLYPVMGTLIRKYKQGIHLKTAGTTWLEEVAGLAEAGETKYIQSLYEQALDRYEELTEAYRDVLNIQYDKLPSASIFRNKTGFALAKMIRHSKESSYDPNVRQLMHTAYKIAAEDRNTLLEKIDLHSGLIGKRVCNNILKNHLIPLFG